MPKNWIFALFLTIFAIGLISGPQSVSAQDKPTPDVKEKAKECEDDDDDEDLTEADRASIKITLANARKIALERVPGKITDQELEKEHGRLQYAFEIVTAEGKEFDVEIDAITGEILNVEDEDDDGDDDDGPVTKMVVKKKVVERTVVVAKKPQ
jgi:Peptidase propeptide and YPEB domain